MIDNFKINLIVSCFSRITGNIIFAIILLFMNIMREKFKIKLKNILIAFFMLSVIMACLLVLYFIHIKPNFNAMCYIAIYILTSFLFVIHESRVPKQAISIMQLIGTSQNYMYKKPKNPIECFVILNMLTSYFGKERSDIIYYTNILENKKYIKRKNGFKDVEQFGLTEKGIEYFQTYKLTGKEIKKF